jgi:hypothetical protein
LSQNIAPAARGAPHDAQNCAFGIEEAGDGVEAIVGCATEPDGAGLAVEDPDGTFPLMMPTLFTIDKMENTVIRAINASSAMRITKSTTYIGKEGINNVALMIFFIV